MARNPSASHAGSTPVVQAVVLEQPVRMAGMDASRQPPIDGVSADSKRSIPDREQGPACECRVDRIPKREKGLPQQVSHNLNICYGMRLQFESTKQRKRKPYGIYYGIYYGISFGMYLQFESLNKQ